MPHLIISYSANLDSKTNMSSLCRSLADTLIALRDSEGNTVFPVGGTRVLAYPAAHWAISDGGAAGQAAGGSGEYAFAYFNLRMARGRSDDTKALAGRAISATVREHFAALLEREHIGLTMQVDEGCEAFDDKISTIHPLFKKPQL